MICAACRSPIPSRNCLKRGEQYACNRLCAMRLGGAGWIMAVRPEKMPKQARSGPVVRVGQDWAARLTHCAKGHEYTPQNTGRHWDGSRLCLTCKADGKARKREMNRASLKARRKTAKRMVQTLISRDWVDAQKAKIGGMLKGLKNDLG